MNQAELRLGTPDRIKRMLNPQSVVFVGGSNLLPAVAFTQGKGYQGQIYIINPYHDEIAGFKCYKTVSQLPQTPDLAFVSVPKEHAIDVVGSLAKCGVTGTVCNSAGFSELKDDGVNRQVKLVEAAAQMPVLGPNCPGFANFVDKAAFMQDHFGDHENISQGVAVISNGGAYLSDLGTTRRSLQVAYLIGVGNQAMISIGDMLDVVLDDPRVKAVNLYIESFHNVPALSRAALKAIRKNVPVVVVKGGRTSAGERAAQTHTASLAGDDIVASALFKRLGFIQAINPIQAIETLKMLTCTKRPTGPRLAFATSSGSYAVLGGDAADQAGLQVAPMPVETVESIKPQIPHFVLPSNPLDIAESQFEADHTHEQIFEKFLTGDQYDIALLMMSFPPPGGWEAESWYRTAASFARICKQLDLPSVFVNTVPEDLPIDAQDQMLKQNVAPLMGMDHGIRAIADALQAHQIQVELKKMSDQEIVLPACKRSVEKRVMLDEYTAKQRLSDVGVSVPISCVIGSSDETAEGLNFPVVLKALSANLLHKTELGAVALNIQNQQELHQVVQQMKQSLSESALEIEVEKFLVEEMICAAVAELMVSIRFVQDIGMVLTLAIGGTTVELLNDTVTVILPASRQSILRALQQLKLYPLLTGWRGQAHADIEAMMQVVDALINFTRDNEEHLELLEVNPLVLCEQGKGAYALDAVLSIRQTDG